MYDEDNLPPDVQRQLDDGFKLTGDHAFQRYKKISDGKYHFFTGYDDYYIYACGERFYQGTIDAEIDFNQLSQSDREKAISGYYDSLKALLEEVDGDNEAFQFLVCECYYEQNIEQ